MIKKTKAHTIYRNSSGKRVDGVTKILSVLAKPALIKWANNLGLRGIDSSKYVDDLADVGTLAHYLIECDLKGIEPDTSEYSPSQLDRAENAYLKYLQWKDGVELEVLGSEMRIVSDRLNVGGTLDLYCLLNTRHTVIDIKTSKAIYSEHKTQACTYADILVEHGKPVQDVKILRFGRTEDEGFDDITVTQRDVHKRRFELCRELYDVNKTLSAN